MSTSRPIRERFTEKLKPADLINVKNALLQYMSQNDPQVKTIKFETLALDDLLPHLQEFSDSWIGVEKKNFNTTLKAFNSVYQCVRHSTMHAHSLSRRSPRVASGAERAR